jgi:predicted phage terminase large subunit-like protein
MSTMPQLTTEQLASLSTQQLRELEELLTPKLTKYIPHAPTPKQAAFLLLQCREAFYGGAAGGGKSNALLSGALQYVDQPGYSAILFRRTYADLSLPGALMDRAREWLSGTDARWIERDKTWLFPSGATVTFGYLESENDKYRYQSAEFQYIGFDELTQFTETQYRYLFSRLRRLRGSNTPLRMRAASNPGGLGHVWVKQRFIVEGPSKGRVFIPAKLEDNPFLDIEEYDESLSELDPITRAQLRSGNWDVRPDTGLFKRSWFRGKIILPDQLPRGLRKVRYWDLAATEEKPGRKGKGPDFTAGLLLGEKGGLFYIMDVRRFRLSPHDVETMIQTTAEDDGLGTWTVMEEEPGATGKMTIDHYARRVLKGFAFKGNRNTGSKALRANPISAVAERGHLYLVAGPWINDFLDELEAFPAGTHDDQVDALSGAYSMLKRDVSIYAAPVEVGEKETSIWTLSQRA